MQQICITLKSFDAQCLYIALKYIINLAHVLEIKTIKKINLPKKIKKITVLRSPHIDKKSREHFEIKHNKNMLIFTVNKKSTGFLFIECLKNLQLSGVEISLDIYSMSYYCS